MESRQRFSARLMIVFSLINIFLFSSLCSIPATASTYTKAEVKGQIGPPSFPYLFDENSMSSSMIDFSSRPDLAGLIDASAFADFGVLKARAESWGYPFPTTSGINAIGRARFEDQFVITGGSGASSAIILMDITGTNLATDDGSTDPYMDAGSWSLDVYKNHSETVIDETFPNSGNNNTSIPISETLSGSFVFTYGVAFDLTVTLETIASTDAYFSGGLESHSIVDLYSTAITSFILPEGATLTSASGTEYNLVPLPGALWLFGSCLIGLVGFKRKSRKK